MSDDGNHSGQIAPEALSRLYAMTSVRRPASLDNLPDDVDTLKQRLVEAEWKASAAESVVREVRAREEGVLENGFPFEAREEAEESEAVAFGFAEG